MLYTISLMKRRRLEKYQRGKTRQQLGARNQPTQMSWDPYFKAWIPYSVPVTRLHVMGR